MDEIAKFLDKYVYIQMTFCTIIHMWLRHVVVAKAP